MAISDLTNEKQFIINDKDNIVIVDVFEEVRGGRTLDVTGYPLNIINAGHVIIKETSINEYKPMPIASDGADGYKYDNLPAGHEYAGILINTIRTIRPFAGIMLRGTVNYSAAPYDVTEIMDDMRESLGLISFVTEE